MSIEFVVGSESHTSYWGKYYVKGLEQWEVEEDRRCDRHHFDRFLVADASTGTIFTIFEQNGNKRGTDKWVFSICVVTDDGRHEDKASYGLGFCNGNYEVLVRGSGKIKAPRLMDWWTALPAGVPAAMYARHLATQIERRGIKEPAPLILDTSSVQVA